MPLSGSIEDRLEIQELYALYADASSSNRRQQWLDCFTDDGQWNSHIFQCTGKDAIRAQGDEIMDMFDGLIFLSVMGPVTIDGDRATARSYAREIGNLKGGGVFKLAGAYEDTLRKENGRWLFERRDYTPVVDEIPA